MIADTKSDVPVLGEGRAAERLAFSYVKWRSVSDSGDNEHIELWSDIMRLARKDENVEFEVVVNVRFGSGRVESFKESISSSTLDLNQLAGVKGDVPSRITVAIQSEKTTATP